MSPRLANIALANTKSRSRDFLFATYVAFIAVISIASIGTAVDAAMQIAQR
ncbi:MAG: hypothetical protein M4D80_31685 [Myxococcota bacterium]|nr:hypothetical protein [Myxococcota bacterium]